MFIWIYLSLLGYQYLLMASKLYIKQISLELLIEMFLIYIYRNLQININKTVPSVHLAFSMSCWCGGHFIMVTTTKRGEGNTTASVMLVFIEFLIIIKNCIVLQQYRYNWNISQWGIVYSAVSDFKISRLKKSRKRKMSLSMSSLHWWRKYIICMYCIM